MPAGSVFCYTGAEMVSGVRALAAALESAKRQDPILLYAKINDSERDMLFSNPKLQLSAEEMADAAARIYAEFQKL